MSQALNRLNKLLYHKVPLLAMVCRAPRRYYKPRPREMEGLWHKVYTSVTAQIRG